MLAVCLQKRAMATLVEEIVLLIHHICDEQQFDDSFSVSVHILVKLVTITIDQACFVQDFPHFLWICLVFQQSVY